MTTYVCQDVEEHGGHVGDCPDCGAVECCDHCMWILAPSERTSADA